MFQELCDLKLPDGFSCDQKYLAGVHALGDYETQHFCEQNFHLTVLGNPILHYQIKGPTGPLILKM